MSNPYTDESGVFKNKLGITNDAELKATEYALTTNRTEELRTGYAVLSTSGYGLDRLQAIHKHIFQDVYEWAGKARTVPSAISSRTRFPSTARIRMFASRTIALPLMPP